MHIYQPFITRTGVFVAGTVADPYRDFAIAAEIALLAEKAVVVLVPMEGMGWVVWG